MKIKVDKDYLSKGISKVIASVNPRNTLPILSNLLIETLNKSTIQITGTDLEIGILSTCEAEVIEEGAITIPAKKFNDIIRESPEEKVEISVSKNNSINIKSGKAFFKLMGLPKDDFPKFPEFSLEQAISLNQELVKECLDLTSFAISTDETRYVLNGALVIIKSKEIKIITTDGRRLAVIEKPLSLSKGTSIEAIIPTKAIHELQRNLHEGGDVKIINLGNQIIFSINSTTIISRLIEGHFPNYQQVLPSEEKIVAKIKRQTLLATVRRVALLTSLESQAVKVDIIKSNKMIISSRSPNVGESKEELSINILKGEELTIGFNPNYIIDVLKNLDIDEVELSLTSPEKPGVLRGKEGYVYVIMPMQIG